MDRDSSQRQRSVVRDLRVDTEGDWTSTQPSPRRVATAPSSPSTAYTTDRETTFRSGSATVSETHVIRSSGSQSQSYTEEHWSSEITSFVATAPPKFIQVIKAYRILSSDTPTLVVEVASEPPAIFEWFCNDKPVLQDKRRFQPRHGLNITTLTIHKPEQGVYKCTARNPAGCSTSYGYITVNFEHHYEEWSIQEKSTSSASEQQRKVSTASITYNHAPRFTNQVPNLTVPPGNEAVIDVEVDADPPARFSWFVNGKEFRDSANNLELYYPKDNRCVARFSIPVSGEYKVVASNVHGSAMSSGYVEIYQAAPARQARPPMPPGEHMARAMMTTSQHTGVVSGDVQQVTSTQTMSVYEVNYAQRSSSVPRGVRHLEKHVEMATIAPESKFLSSSARNREPRTMHKTRSEGSRYLPHAPRFLTELPKEITVQSNEKLVLSVDVEALPAAEIKWNVNGFEVRPSKSVTLLNEQNKSTLVLNPPIKQGKYNVTAMNDIGKDTLITKVLTIVTKIVEEIHSEISIGPVTAPDIVESAVTVTSAQESDWEVIDDVSQNSSTSLETVLKQSEPIAQKVEQETPAQDKFVKQQELSVPLKEEELVPTKEQTVVKVAFTKTASKTTEDMPRKPILTQQPIQHIHVTSGERLVLESFVDSSPPSTFQWYVNNFEVKRGEFTIIEEPAVNSSRIVFLTPAPGQYKVVASNIHGRVETVTRVTTEMVQEEYLETTTVTSNVKQAAPFRLKKKTVAEKSNLPKPPTMTKQLPATIRIPEGHCLSLKASVDAIPEAVFTWLLNNFELKPSSNVVIVSPGPNQSEIQIQNAGAGKYEVVARNNLGQDNSFCKVIVVYVDHEQPKNISTMFIQTLTEETFVLDSECRFTVTVSGLPPYQFDWRVNGEDYNVFNTVEGNRSTLILPSPPPEGSTVSVTVTNTHDVVFTQTIIRNAQQSPVPKPKTRSPVIVKPIDNLEITNGDSLVWGIGVDREGSPCTFDWILDHEKLESNREVQIDSTGYESLLSWTPATVGGEMTVVVSNRHGKAVSSAVLTVAGRAEPFEMVAANLPEESAPKIVVPLHSMTFADGQPMVLRCQITATPSAAVEWSKDDINVEEWVINKDVSTQIYPDGVCELINPECFPEDSGLYKCQASNPYGTAETSAFISVEREEYKKDREEASMSESFASELHPIVAGQEIILLPKFVEPLSAELDGIEQLNYIRLVCRAVSGSAINVAWKKDDKLLTSTEKYEFYQFEDGTQILTIHSPISQDNGIYTCTVESDQGLASTSTEVVIKREVVEEFNDMEIVPIPVAIPVLPVPTTVEVEVTTKVMAASPAPTDDVAEVTEIRKHEEEFKLLVKVADSVASTLVANIFVDAVREAARRIVAEESSEDEDLEVIESGAPRFNTTVEEYVATEGGPIKISISVSGYPTPFVEWYFGEKQLKITENLSMSYEKGIASLHLKAVHFDHAGTYYLQATNPHGTTVLSTKLSVVPKPADMNIRTTLAKYDKFEADERVVTNVFAHQPEPIQQQDIKVLVKRSDSQMSLTVAKEEEFEMVKKSESITPPDFEMVEAEQHVSEQQQDVTVQQHPMPIIVTPAEEQKQSVIEKTASLPSVIILEEKPVPTPRTKKAEFEAADAQAIPEAYETAIKNAAEKFAGSFTEKVLNQVQDIIRTSKAKEEHKETQIIKTLKTVVLDREEEIGRRSVTIPFEEKVKTIESRLEAAASPDLSAEAAVNMVMETVMSLKKEHITDQELTVDVRNPDGRFDHVVTVVEPEVLQLTSKISAMIPQLKFIDIDTILQRPGTSQQTDCLLSTQSKKNANAEHRVIVLEGASQNFQNAMTWSLRKMQRLAEEEGIANANIEIVRPPESSFEATVVVDAEKIIPDLLQVAAAASKLKLENVTVSLVKRGDSSHTQLVIEYESQVEDESDVNHSHLECERPTETKEQMWSRRSRFSEEDERVAGVFVEVDAVCPDQSVEIMATVNMPIETAAEQPFSRATVESLEHSQSLTETSGALQPPKFFRQLVNNQAVVGNPVQFKCIVSGTPTPQVIWSVDGDVIEPNNEYNIVYEDGVSILKISEVVSEDEGEYWCEAVNSAGRASTKCFLKVLNPEWQSDSLEGPSDPDSTDLFEWEERKIQELIDREHALLASLEQSRISGELEYSDLNPSCSYNDDLKEENAFHKYYETAETAVLITEFYELGNVEASVKAPSTRKKLERNDSTSTTDASFSNRKKNSFCVAATRLEKQSSRESASVTAPNDLWDSRFNNPFGSESAVKADETRLFAPRTPLLPIMMSYKGQKIDVSVNEVEKEEKIVNEDGQVEISKKTCLETLLEFNSPLGNPKKISTKKTQPSQPQVIEAEIEELKVETETLLAAMERAEKELKQLEQLQLVEAPNLGDEKDESSMMSLNGTENELLALLRDSQSKSVELFADKSPEPTNERPLETITAIGPLEKEERADKVAAETIEVKPSRVHEKETPILTKTASVEVNKDSQVAGNPEQSNLVPKFADNPGPKPAAKQELLSPSKSNQQFLDTMKQIEKIAKNVEHELAEISYSTGDDAKSIEEAILVMSDRLVMQHPLTEAQAEATEELLRTTLADMILNPSRTVEEEIEIMKKPIRLLRRRISEIENSLMEDSEVQQLVKAEGKALSTSETVMAPSTKVKRVFSAELIRMTPLTSNIKDQLTQLEDMINEHMESEATESYKAEPTPATQKRKELHSIFMQINEEINTIRTFCSKKLTKKGSDAVMSVLHKVRAHITSIVNVMSLAKKKKVTAIDPVASGTFYFVRDDEYLHVEGVIVYKKRFMETSFLQQSSTQRSFATISTSDDTWKLSKIDRSSRSTRASSDTKKESLKTLAEEPIVEERSLPLFKEPPKPPPRRKRTASADPRLINTAEEAPVPPPRTKKQPTESLTIPAEERKLDDKPPILEKTASLDRKNFFMRKASSEKAPASSSPIPTKPKRSFADGALGLFKHLKNPLKKKDKRKFSREYEPLVNEQDLNDENVLQFRESSNLLDELRMLSMECRDLNLEQIHEPIYDEVARSKSTEKKKEVTPPYVTETCVDDYDSEEVVVCEVELNLEEGVPQEETKSVAPVVPPHQPRIPNKWSEEQIETLFTSACSQDAFTTEADEIQHALVAFPQPQQYMADYTINTEDTYSVQMVCEESDYATDTDTSCMLRGCVQFFRASPLIPFKEQQQSIEKIMEESFEGEIQEVLVNVELRSVDCDDAQDEAQFSFAEMLVYESDLDSEAVSEKPKREIQTSQSKSDQMVVNPVEETDISEIFSSTKTVDQETPILRETDIISDVSQQTELESQINGNFDFARMPSRRKILAQVSQEVFQCATASIAENLFEVFIEQEPENLGLIIKITEEQVDFTSLTVFEDLSEAHPSQYLLDPNNDFTETSSFDEYEGDDSRTGLDVSIIARSLHDSIYASLEEIPWGEVQMTVKENEMCRSGDTSLQFNVTVSENADERKSLRSQPSLRESQNSISESNTPSNSSINIPSYVIKLGSTATITCELNNYLAPNSRIDWVKGKKLIVRTPGKFDRISHDLLEVLIINNVDFADNELYSLKVNEDVFPVAFILVEDLDVDVPSTILSPPQTQFVMEGQPTEIFVQVNKNAQDVEWFKDKKPLGDSTRMAVGFTDSFSKVVFSETRVSDQGTYLALLGEQTVATTLVVEERIDEKEVTVVASGTESEEDDIQQYLVPPGSTATIACELEETDNRRSLVWIRDGRPLVFNQSEKLEHVVNGLKHYLVIHDTGLSDSGLYSVSISGTEFRVAHLVVNDLATSIQSSRRKRISNVSLNK